MGSLCKRSLFDQFLPGPLSIRNGGVGPLRQAGSAEPTGAEPSSLASQVRPVPRAAPPASADSLPVAHCCEPVCGEAGLGAAGAVVARRRVSPADKAWVRLLELRAEQRMHQGVVLLPRPVSRPWLNGAPGARGVSCTDPPRPHAWSSCNCLHTPGAGGPVILMLATPTPSGGGCGFL